MTKPENAHVNESSFGKRTVRSLRNDLKRVVPIWLVLLGLSGLGVALLKFYSIPLIKKIEYGETNPYTLAIVYAEEGKKYWGKCLKKIDRKITEGKKKQFLKNDPDLVRAKKAFLHSLRLYARNADIYGYLADLASIEGNFVDFHYYLGLLNAAKNRPEEALEGMDAALKIEPKKIEALLKKVEILISMRNLEEAERIANIAGEVKPGESEVYYLLARISALKQDPEKAIELLKRSVELKPDNIRAAKMLADYLFGREDKKGAIDVLRNAEQYAPKDANLKHLLGRYLYEVQRYEAAAEVLERAEKIEKFSAPLYLDLARTYRRLGKERLSAIMLEKAIKIDPKLGDKVLSE